MGNLTFDAAIHEYRLDGKWIPGVTRILGDCGFYKGSEFYTEESRTRGRQAHLACQLADQHCPNALTLDEALDTLDLAPALLPYLQGYLLFKQERRYKPYCNETKVYMGNPLAAGTIDSIGTYGPRNRTALIDLKSWKGSGPNPQPAALIQTAAYRMMAKDFLAHPVQHVDVCVIVALPGNGSYRIYESANEREGFIFQCCAHEWWWKFTNKLIDKQEKYGEEES
jgi:hypothetical protein